MTDTSYSIRKTIRIDREVNGILEKILEEKYPEGYRRPTVSALIRQGIFIVIAAYGMEVPKQERKGYYYYPPKLRNPHRHLNEDLPIVLNWVDLIKEKDPKDG